MASHASNINGTNGANAPLNPDRRPQRLYLKTEIAMKIVDKRLNDKKFTGIADWLNQEDLQRFRNAVRIIIRTQ